MPAEGLCVGVNIDFERVPSDKSPNLDVKTVKDFVEYCRTARKLTFACYKNRLGFYIYYYVGHVFLLAFPVLDSQESCYRGF